LTASGGGQRRHLVPPQVASVGPTVQQHNRLAAAAAHVQGDVFEFDEHGSP